MRMTDKNCKYVTKQIKKNMTYQTINRKNVVFGNAEVFLLPMKIQIPCFIYFFDVFSTENLRSEKTIVFTLL